MTPSGQRRTRVAAVAAVAAVAVAASAVLSGSAGAKAGHTVFTATAGPATLGLSLEAVAALSAHDAWAVGTPHPGGKPNPPAKAAVDHWNGTAWTAVPGPAGARELTSIAAVSAHDIWVGGFHSPLFGATEVWHFNGHSWSSVPSAGLPAGITGKVVANAHHTWLMGEVDPGSRIEGAVIGTYRPSRHRWSVDDVSRIGGFVDGAAIGSRQAWAVGSTSKYADLGHPLISHWNGHRWTVKVFSHVLGQLTNIAGHSTKDLIAVGFNGTNFRHQGGVGLAWNGTRWRPVNLGHDPGLDNFTSLAPGPGKEYWAGITGRDRLNDVNYLHYTSGAWVHTRGPHPVPANRAVLHRHSPGAGTRACSRDQAHPRRRCGGVHLSGSPDEGAAGLGGDHALIRVAEPGNLP